MPNFWLMKSEPSCFSIDDLAAAPDKTTFWDGVRNYQARNFMREMRIGDQALFYHSVTYPAVVGLVKIVREAYPDHTAWDHLEKHHDPASTHDKSRWDMVDVRLVEKFPKPLSLSLLRAMPSLAGMELLRKGSRLSIQPVTESQFKTILQLTKTMQ